eukprot:354229-Chlamydomonas_euryale.AAC.1
MESQELIKQLRTQFSMLYPGTHAQRDRQRSFCGAARSVSRGAQSVSCRATRGVMIEARCSRNMTSPCKITKESAYSCRICACTAALRSEHNPRNTSQLRDQRLCVWCQQLQLVSGASSCSSCLVPAAAARVSNRVFVHAM